jgi:hypothetical protein
VQKNLLHKAGAAASPSTGGRTRFGWRRWLRGQRPVTVLVSIRPVRPRVVTSNVITPRSSANLVRLPFLVLLELPVVAPHDTEQTFHGPPTSKDRMAIPPMSVCSVFTGGFRYRPRASAQRQLGFMHTRVGSAGDSS